MAGRTTARCPPRRPPVRIPDRFRTRLRHEPQGEAWIEALPARLHHLEKAWGVRLGDPVAPGGVTSLVLHARTRDGTGAFCKLPFPDPEQAGEAAALALVGGDGAVRLLAHDADSDAMLLEAADPTRSLLDDPEPERAFDLAADLLARWWRPVPDRPVADGFQPIPNLSDLTPGFSAEVERRRDALRDLVPTATLDRVLEVLHERPGGPDVLLHGDLHLDNILPARREPWLLIDPKPAFGPAAYDLQPLLRDHLPDGHDATSVARRRFDRLTERLDLDRDNARLWVLARGVALGSWSLVETGDGRRGEREIAVALAVGG